MTLRFLRRGPNRAAPPRHPASDRLPELHYPLGTRPRIAVLGLTVRQEPGIHVFPQWSCHALEAVRPQALAGWRRELDVVVRLQQCGRLTLPELSLPLLVFSTPNAGPLGDSDHDFIWGHFQLPILEQIRYADGTLVAVECDAHLGFHTVLPPVQSVYEGNCPCGKAPRWNPAPVRPLATAAGD